MRLAPVVIFLVASALLLFFGTPRQAQSLDSKAVKKAVEQYVDPQSTDAKRSSLLEALAKAKNADVASALKSCARKSENRANALELAVQLHVRGQFSTFDKWFSEDPENTARLGLITGDKGAAKALQKRWADAEMDSEDFTMLTGVFQRYGADLDALEEFKNTLEKGDVPEAKQSAAAAILKYQFGLDTSDPTEIMLRWGDLQKEYNAQGERFPMTGMDLLALDGWLHQSTRRVGNNFILSGEKSILRLIEGTPASMKNGGYSVTLHARLEADFKGDIGLLVNVNGEHKISGLQAGNGKWSFSLPSGLIEHPIKPGKWMTVTLTSTNVGGVSEWAYAIDGKELAKQMRANGEVSGFIIQCLGGKGTFGGLDYSRN